MTVALGVVMDPIAAINYKKDTTLALLWAAQDRGWQLFYMEQSDLRLQDGEPRATVRALRVHRDAAHWFDLGEPTSMLLADLNVILMRKDPPFDNEYVYSTYILEAAEKLGVLIANQPQSLRDCNEKMFATQFPQCCPPLLVSRDSKQLKEFHRVHGDVVFKPLDGMGGSSIFRVRQDDPNLNVILEVLTQHGRNTIMAQRYIPAIVDGDKRILMIDGEPVPYCLARVPMAGESRGNLAAGGSGRPQPLSERDRWIAAQVGPELKRRGLLFVGLDVIGDYLTEINVTSPTCAREIDAAYATDIGAKLMDCIAAKLASASLIMAYTAEPFQPRHDLFGFTLLLALALHAVFILGISFTREQHNRAASKLEITLAQYKSATKPKKADFLAQHNQEGSGTLDEKALLTTRKTSDFHDNVIRDISPLQQTAAQQQKSAQTALIATRNHAEHKTALQNDRDSPTQQAQGELTIQQRNLEIASLEAKLDVQRQAYAARPRTRRLTSVAASFSEDAHYLNLWRERIEGVGNNNYPERAREQNIYGELRLMVALLPNGEISDIKILKSSGHKILDQAAIRIVHLAAPYDAFPPEMRQQVDVLEIIRTWRFHKDHFSSTN